MAILFCLGSQGKQLRFLLVLNGNSAINNLTVRPASVGKTLGEIIHIRGVQMDKRPLKAVEVPWMISPSEPDAKIELGEEEVIVDLDCIVPIDFHELDEKLVCKPIRIKVRFYPIKYFYMQSVESDCAIDESLYDVPELLSYQFMKIHHPQTQKIRDKVWRQTKFCPTPGFYTLDHRSDLYLLNLRYSRLIVEVPGFQVTVL